MARRKGKSERRIKNWQDRFGDADRMADASDSRGKIRRRAVKLRGGSFSDSQEAVTGLKQREGMVVGVFKRGAYIRIDGEELFCGIAKTFRAPRGASPLAVGDVVTFAMTRTEHTDGQREIDKDRMDGMIVSRQPRRSALSRPRPRSGRRRNEHDTDVFEKVLAANMDVLLIVAATRQPPLRHGLIDRFLIIADRGELEPVLVINKIDLGAPDADVLADFASLGVRCFPCSAATGEGLDALKGALTDKQSVLAGASGVGKSTLINAIIPGAEVVTRAVREKDERGRHTTTAAIVYELPNGGRIVDTPGIRELGIPLDRNEIAWYFPELEALAPQCKFRDCTHTHEPDCAVVSAAQAGAIPPRRYNSYLRILEDLDT